MKKLMLIAAISCFTISVFAQKNATVPKASGKYFYYYNEPLTEYEVVFSFQTTVSTCVNSKGIAEAAIKSAALEAGLIGKSFDAVIIGAGERDIAIKFKNKENVGIALINQENGFYIYHWCDPLDEFEVSAEEKIFRVDTMTGECRWEKVITDKLIKKAFKLKKKKSVNAIIVGNDQYHKLIQLK